MNCKFQIATLLALIVVCAHIPEGSANPRCLCLNFVDWVPKKYLKDFLVIPRSSHCTQTQIILTVNFRGTIKEACLNSRSDQGTALVNCWNRINNEIGRKGECIRTLRRIRNPK